MSEKKSSFVTQAAILASAALLARVIGFLYRLPLTNMIGDQGLGIYGAGYQVYNFLFILSSAGLPAAISKMVSERIAHKQYHNAHRVFEFSLLWAGIVGFMCSLFLFVFARPIAELIDNPNSYASLVTLAPTIFLVSIMSVYRGYFQGMGDSLPTALSQIADQIFNAAFSLILANLLLKRFSSVAMGAAGATAGTGVGAIIGISVMMGIFILYKPKISRRVKREKGVIVYEGKRKIAKELVATAFPIIAGTAIFSFTNLVDVKMVVGRLTSSGHSQEMAEALYGQLTNKYVSITTLPVAISSAMATASIPSIASSLVLNKRKEVSGKINTSLRLAMIISIPAAMGIGVLADQILLLLFKGFPEGGAMLKVGAISVVFLALAQISTGMLQGIGKLKVPAIAALCGVLVKIPLNYILIGIPSIGIIGAIISTIACYMVASFVDMYCLKKATGMKLDIMGILIKPGFASIIMGMVCYVVYYITFFYTASNTLGVILAIAASIASYFAAMLFIGGLNKQDIALMPMGNTVIRYMQKMGLYKYLKNYNTESRQK